MTEVVAALIWKENRFLICQRPEKKACALLWEFAGGKVEAGETPEQALIRECREELGIAVRPLGAFAETTYAYPDITVHLMLFHAAVEKGDPQCLEHHDMRWILPSEIPMYPFCSADKEILEKIQKEYGEHG